MPTTDNPFITDQPIEKADDDLLGRASFSRELGNAINAYKGKDSMVVGLYGAWGSGKTSIINMAMDHIKNTPTKNNKEKYNVIVRFNPWNYSDQNQLITQFFAQLSTELKKPNFSDNDKEMAEKTAGLLLEYALIIEPTASIFIASFLARLAKIFRSYKVKDLAAVKSDLQKSLLQIPAQIIIVIDDIDRLNNTEIRQIFQLVKSLGDFHNTVYLLAFDRQVVTDALAEVQKGSGNEYLEKIVQVPFEMPLADEQEIEKLLLDHLKELIEKDTRKSPTFNSMHWWNIYHSGLRNFLKNIRDVNRYINSLRFSYGLVKDEVNPVDFIAITALQVFLPEVYSSIKSNKSLFTGAFTSGEHIPIQKDKEMRACDEILNKANGLIKEEQLKDFIKFLFPRIDAIYRSNPYSVSGTTKECSRGRICDPYIFDSYFSLYLPKSEIPMKKISRVAATTNSYSGFSQELNSLIKEEKIIKFLSRFRSDYIQARDENALPEKNIPNVIKAIINLGDLFPGSDAEFVEPEPFRSISSMLDELLEQITDKVKRYKILKDAIASAKDGLYTSVYIIGWLDSSRASATGEVDILSTEQLAELKKLACGKIEKCANGGTLSKQPGLRLVLHYWEQWEAPSKAKDFVATLIKTDEGLINFIASFLSTSTHYNTEHYVGETRRHISPEAIGKYVETKSIKGRVRKIEQSNKFDKYSDRQKLAVNIFLDTVDRENTDA